MVCRYTSACSNNIRDSMQASMRVRHIKSGNLVYGSYPRYIGAERFDVMSRARLRAMIDGREQYAKHVMDARGDQVWQQRGVLEEWQKQLWVLTTAENNTSAFLHRELLDAYVRVCGYEVRETELSMGEAVEAHVDAIDYFEIPDVGSDAYRELEGKVQSGMASAEDKLQYLKGNFKCNIVPGARDMEAGLVSSMFRAYAKNQMGIMQRISNHTAEACPGTIDQLESLFRDNQAQKAAIVKELCGYLGISTAFDVGRQIERSVMQQSCEKVLAMKKELQAAFDLRLRESPKLRGTLKRGLEILNQVLAKWGMTEVALEVPRRRGRIEGKRVEVGDFVVKEKEGYRGFVENSVKPGVRRRLG